MGAEAVNARADGHGASQGRRGARPREGAAQGSAARGAARRAPLLFLVHRGIPGKGRALLSGQVRACCGADAAPSGAGRGHCSGIRNAYLDRSRRTTQSPADKYPLCFGVCFAIRAIHPCKVSLQLRIFCCQCGICSQPVAKGDALSPEGGAERHKMEVMCAVRGTGLAKPVHYISAVRRVSILKLSKCVNRRPGTFEAFDRRHDVDDRLRGEPRNCRAPYMLNRPRQPGRQDLAQEHAFRPK